MRPFNLIRYFTVASLVAIVVLAIALAWTFSRNLERNLTEEAGLYAQDVSRLLNRSILQEFLLPRAQRGETIDLEDPAQRRALDAVVADRTKGFRLLTLNLFDATGTVVYSTNPAYVGFRSVDNPGLDVAFRGEVASVLKRSELERDPIRPGHDLLETYAPFYELEAGSDQEGQIIGVLELYQDARPITAKIAEGQRQILVATIALMSLLFAVLFEIVRRGHVRITDLTDALGRSNRELEVRVEERTREIDRARHRLRGLFDGIADGISVIDQEFRVSEHNSGIERLFGARGAEGGTGLCYELQAGRASPCPGCPARVTMRSGGKAERRYRWPAAGAAEIEVEVTTFPFTTAEGRPAVIEVVRDVSERSELERQIIQSESLASLGEIAAGVAHEIRNPIGMITSSAQLLDSGALSEREREILGVIRTESKRVSDTVSEFVRFATPPQPSRTASEPMALLERVRTMLRPEAERRGVELELEAEPDLPKILIDPELLYRAIANLVLNALQVQGEGGRVVLHAGRDSGSGVVLRVSDRGPGIPEEDLERIFQPFFTRRVGGTGLGLSIVQRIVSANGGRVGVSSGPGGTTFTLRFEEADA